MNNDRMCDLAFSFHDAAEGDQFVLVTGEKRTPATPNILTTSMSTMATMIFTAVGVCVCLKFSVGKWKRIARQHYRNEQKDDERPSATRHGNESTKEQENHVGGMPTQAEKATGRISETPHLDPTEEPTLVLEDDKATAGDSSSQLTMMIPLAPTYQQSSPTKTSLMKIPQIRGVSTSFNTTTRDIMSASSAQVSTLLNTATTAFDDDESLHLDCLRQVAHQTTIAAHLTQQQQQLDPIDCLAQAERIVERGLHRQEQAKNRQFQWALHTQQAQQQERHFNACREYVDLLHTMEYQVFMAFAMSCAVRIGAVHYHGLYTWKGGWIETVYALVCPTPESATATTDTTGWVQWASTSKGMLPTMIPETFTTSLCGMNWTFTLLLVGLFVGTLSFTKPFLMLLTIVFMLHAVDKQVIVHNVLAFGIVYAFGYAVYYVHYKRNMKCPTYQEINQMKLGVQRIKWGLLGLTILLVLKEAA